MDVEGCEFLFLVVEKFNIIVCGYYCILWIVCIIVDLDESVSMLGFYIVEVLSYWIVCENV